MAKKLPPPTDKMRRFAAEYLVDCCAAKAARRAGYSPRNAKSHGHYLLHDPRVEKLIAEGRARLMERTEVTAERVIEEFARVAFADLRNVAEWGGDRVSFRSSAEISDAAAAAISSIKSKVVAGATEDNPAEVLEVKLWPKTDALRALARHLGIEGSLELSGPGGAPLFPREPETPEEAQQLLEQMLGSRHEKE